MDMCLPTQVLVRLFDRCIFERANEPCYHLVNRQDLIERRAFEAMSESASTYSQRIAQVMATKRSFYGRQISVMLSQAFSALQ
ncbi:MAG: hypothetical protein ACRYGA_03715 [Janthinobacterium lividum]